MYSEDSHKVSLRAMEPEDLDILYRIENDVTLWKVGATNVPHSRYVLHDYIATASGDIYVDRQVRLIVENGEGDVVGLVDIVDFDPQHLRAEVGIVIMSQYRNLGYAGAALSQVASYSLDILHLHQLYAFVDKANAPSLSLFRKMGYRECGELRDWLYDGKAFHDALLMQLFL